MKTFTVPIFDCIVRYTENREEFDKFVAKCQDEQAPKDVSGMTVYNPEYGVMIGVFDGELSTFIHELAHAAYDVLWCSGVEHDAENQEAYAYMLEYLHTRLIGTFNGYRNSGGRSNQSPAKPTV